MNLADLPDQRHLRERLESAYGTVATPVNRAIVGGLKRAEGIGHDSTGTGCEPFHLRLDEGAATSWGFE